MKGSAAATINARGQASRCKRLGLAGQVEFPIQALCTSPTSWRYPLMAAQGGIARKVPQPSRVLRRRQERLLRRVGIDQAGIQSVGCAAPAAKAGPRLREL